MRNIICFLLLLFFSSALLAQKNVRINGYYLSLEGDTIYGNLFNKNDMYLKYRSPEGKKKSFTPSRIKGFHIDSSDYVSLYLREFEGYRYMKILEKGNCILFDMEVSKPTEKEVIMVGAMMGLGGTIAASRFKELNSGMYIKFEHDSMMYSVPNKTKLLVKLIENHFHSDSELVRDFIESKKTIFDFQQFIKQYNYRKSDAENREIKD